MSEWVDRDLHGLRTDPFASYPVKTQVWLSEAVDFCTETPSPPLMTSNRNQMWT